MVRLVLLRAENLGGNFLDRDDEPGMAVYIRRPRVLVMMMEVDKKATPNTLISIQQTPSHPTKQHRQTTYVLHHGHHQNRTHRPRRRRQAGRGRRALQQLRRRLQEGKVPITMTSARRELTSFPSGRPDVHRLLQGEQVQGPHRRAGLPAVVRRVRDYLCERGVSFLFVSFSLSFFRLLFLSKEKKSGIQV